MDAGSLRERISIRRPVNTKNSRGGLDRTWSDVATVWAEVKSLDGREAVIGSVLQGVAHFQITIRYRTDIQMSDQALWGTRELNIHSAEDRLGTKQWTVIHASTEAPQGA